MNRELLYIGVDLGTRGCRAVAITHAGRILHTVRRELPAPERHGDRSEQDPHLWWQAVRTLVAELARVTAPRPIAALAVDGTSPTTLVCDSELRPLAPALMYDDRRSRQEAERIAASAPPDSATRAATSSLAKALHLYRAHPAAAYVLHQADWIAGRLTGRGGISDEHNALKLGYDPEAQRWPEWVTALLPSRLLPQVVRPGTDIGPIREDVRRELGLPPGVRVVSGTTDSTAAFLATGARDAGDAVTSLGSTLVVKVLAPRPVFAAEYGVYSHPVGDLWLVGGGSNTGGAVLLRYFTRDRLEELSTQLRPTVPTGLAYYPLCGPGERFPVNDPDYSPRLVPRPDDPVLFLQALLEGMARIEADGYRLLQRLGAPYPHSVRSAGGGAANHAWTAIRARLLGVPMLTPEHTEAAYGAALLARGGATRRLC